jgi:hypothetical protein
MPIDHLRKWELFREFVARKAVLVFFKKSRGRYSLFIENRE